MQPMLNIALRAARAASELIFRSIERLDTIKVDEKDAKDYVSEVDRAAEQKIIDALRKAYPNHSIMGEETANNFYATGTRTDRGLEAITLAIPPTPGRSIVK
ncbi:inositol monophosphatase family protein, partial [Pseudomonas sp. NPDC089569]|uniref:inositol monophosphatase family protein n=1 Tax=Pseudomonas sp. NPDC089569 TaxID=3390722 RepID=UPI003CFBF739